MNLGIFGEDGQAFAFLEKKKKGEEKKKKLRIGGRRIGVEEQVRGKKEEAFQRHQENSLASFEGPKHQ